MQNRIYISSVLLAAASPALSQHYSAPTPHHLPSSDMPSFTTQVVTSALTVTSFLTMTSSAQHAGGDIIGPIEGLAQCSQTIIFDCLQDSKCSPTDFPCICDELKAHDIEAKIKAACSAEDNAAYLVFEADVCNNVKPTPYPVSSGYPVTSGYPVSSGYPMSSHYPVPPPANSTVPSYNTTSTHVHPTPVTSVIVVTSTNDAGKPTTMHNTVVGPPGPPASPAPPAPSAPVSPPEYTGAAAVVNVQNAMLAGGVGFMGLIFAGL
ncbi:hypothetical protein IAQ61_002996 [Plenodomus lingam]|uniref:Predicted protein n=1 Tax=Leptosphaeria maculans (strain JN3 / isolate v23.1.3 / race Av1-4-5-6-7-8) TaxID=985895 RepID=E5A826_LEPMJ|nr:predicted protein [Plenodomus lingam JN3]KAH9877628.1 hypothetical protein IAQ61_002996 [Plenodomus lingam]CBX99771.1 predicted protein [Plenodomus lingam JN3]